MKKKILLFAIAMFSLTMVQAQNIAEQPAEAETEVTENNEDCCQDKPFWTYTERDDFDYSFSIVDKEINVYVTKKNGNVAATYRGEVWEEPKLTKGDDKGMGYVFTEMVDDTGSRRIVALEGTLRLNLTDVTHPKVTPLSGAFVFGGELKKTHQFSRADCCETGKLPCCKK